MWTPQHAAELAEFGKVRPALSVLGVDLLSMERRQPDVAVVMPEGAGVNRQAYALAWELLGRGMDFDTVTGADARGYSVRLRPGGRIPAGLPPVGLTPSEGYQLARLTSADGAQALVYLRNAAGGIVNVGEGRACYLRQPDPATAAVTLAEGAVWHSVRAFDLDDESEVQVARTEGSRTIMLARDSTHDYVLTFRR
jgi:hypothetical protein